ncbi:putative esterase with patatin domain protein [Legionella gratiana]|uniref:Esterase with patatin domain protein n=1 Tax=Legionella gratiana TaxID=45066 RepID=A0A378J5P8_9GAMM|nr:patatin-like phospholipase family protein [Legionella gratiana]KTD06047.1 putative esterase with patatin domain protein [Legionella gratiana]STX42726.1 putative esterase with patatin domain [Legionella gratiana]
MTQNKEETVDENNQEIKQVERLQGFIKSLLPPERGTGSGGGAKGVVNSGVYKALVTTDILKNMKMFSGASAGAITSTIWALGMPPEKFRETMLNTNLKQLMGKRVNKKPGNDTGCLFGITKDGQPLLDFIRSNIIETVRENLVIEIKRLIKQKKTCPDDLNDLIDELKKTEPKITFSHLKILNEHFPETFKKLSLNAVSFPDGAMQIFSSETTPDVEIALACRASASIPVVLEPVTIEIDSVERKFVDGGLYDNLPTDYFDYDAVNGAFVPNKKPLQTLVFAFGEGLDNDTNPVFQALYSNYLEAWENINQIKMKLDSIDHLPNSSEELARFLKDFFNQELSEEIKIESINQSIDKVLNKYKGKNETVDYGKISALLFNQIKEDLDHTIYKADWKERLKRNKLVRIFGDLKTDYKNTHQKEIGYDKLRTQYPLNTIELRVGSLTTTSFDEATKVARIMDAMGFLDTITHLVNHDLHVTSHFVHSMDEFPSDLSAYVNHYIIIDKENNMHELYHIDEQGQINRVDVNNMATYMDKIKALKASAVKDQTIFNADQFYIDLVENFKTFYQKIGNSREMVKQDDPLMKKIVMLENQLQDKSKAVVSREVYYLIKENAEKKLTSAEAFALSRAVEVFNKNSTMRQVETEIAEKKVDFLIDEYEKWVQEFRNRVDEIKESKLTKASENVLKVVQKGVEKPLSKTDPATLTSLIKVLRCASKTLDDRNDETKSADNIIELTNLSKKISINKCINGDSIKKSLCYFALAAAACIGILLIPVTGGGSLLLTIAGVMGLSAMATAATVATVAGTAAAAGRLAYAYNNDNGLSSKVSKFKEALDNIKGSAENREARLGVEVSLRKN